MKLLSSLLLLYVAYYGNAQVLDSDSIEHIILEDDFEIIVDPPPCSPSFPNGTEAYLSWLSDEIVVPEELKDEAARCTSIAFFIVNKSGEVSDIEIKYGTCPSFNSAVKEAMGKSPDWIPAVLNGDTIQCAMTVPVHLKFR